MTRLKIDENKLEKRPLVLFTVVWGKQFCDYLTTFHFPSLLAAGNLPCDIGREKIIIISGPQRDYDYLKKSEIFQEIQKYAAVEWINFEPAPGRQIRSMSIGLSLGLGRASELNAVACQFPPDSIYSDNTIFKFGEYIDQGFDLVLGPALRCDEEKFLALLNINRDNKVKIQKNSIDLSELVLNSLHSQVQVTNVESKFFFSKSHIFHISGKGNMWFVAKNMSWSPSLLDLKGISRELIEESGKSVLDSYILAKMYKKNAKIKFITDSSEFFLASWAPADWSAISCRPSLIQRIRWCKRIYNDYAARKSLRYYLVFNQKEDDWIKRFSLLNITLSLGDKNKYGAEMRTAEINLDKFLRKSSADLLHIGNQTYYMKILDEIILLNQKLDFMLRVLLGKRNARNHFVYRITKLLVR